MSLPTRFCWIVPLLGILFAHSPVAYGQEELVADADDSAVDPSDPKRPFLLSAQTTETTEALEDFARYSKRKSWKRAFQALEKVVESKPAGLIAGKEGFMVSFPTLLRKTLADLPPEGRAAYRLFYDAQAKKLLDEAQGEAELTNLTQIFTSYFATSSGPEAANRLGDIHFEQGDMSQAAKCWRAILEYHPESEIPRVYLLVKTAVARTRTGRWGAFREIQQRVRNRYKEETVVLGGKSVGAVQFLDELTAELQPGSVAESQSNQPVSELGVTDELLWQFRFLSTTDAKTIQQSQQRWGPRLQITRAIPSVVVDDARVYVNLIGHHMALDLKTGKLLWRSARFHDFAKKVAQQPYQVMPEQFRVVNGGGRIWFVSRDIKQLSNRGAHFRLICVNPQDGKTVWSSETKPDLKEWSIGGTPIVTEQLIYVAAVKPQKATELFALAIQADSGKLLWSTKIGTHRSDVSRSYYSPRTAVAELCLHEDRLYVETHNGALVELDTKTGGLNWGFVYDSEVPNTQNFFYQVPKVLTSGPPIVRDGVLYFKGMRSSRLCALRLAGPSLAWQRPVSQSAMILGIDGGQLLLGGEEVMAIDPKTRRLQWSARVPLGTDWVRPVFTSKRIYQFTPRGIFELNRANGDVVSVIRGADLESLGGAILVTPRALLTVSNLGVTAYRLAAKSSATTKPKSNSKANVQESR